MGPRVERQWALDHWDGDTFVFPIGLPEVTPDSLALVSFDLDASTMFIEYYDANGSGTFHHVQ